MREIEQTVTRLEGAISSGDQLAQAEMKLLKSELELLQKEVDEKVDISRYIIVERVVFGLVTLVLSSVIIALISIVVQSGSGGGVPGV